MPDTTTTKTSKIPLSDLSGTLRTACTAYFGCSTLLTGLTSFSYIASLVSVSLQQRTVAEAVGGVAMVLAYGCLFWNVAAFIMGCCLTRVTQKVNAPMNLAALTAFLHPGFYLLSGLVGWLLHTGPIWTFGETDGLSLARESLLILYFVGLTVANSQIWLKCLPPK